MYKIIIICTAIFFFSINVIPQIKNNISKRKNIENEIKIIEDKILILNEQIKKYQHFIEKLDDNFEQERIARNNLRMVKENEVIYRLIEKDDIKEE